MKNICDWNNCSEEGLFKAPKERDNSKNFRLLCLEHVKEFNKNWNYFSGMNDQQIMDFLRSDLTWHKPTQSFSSSDNFFKVLWNNALEDKINIFEKINQKYVERSNLSEKDRHALQILGLNYQAKWDDIQKKFKGLVKKYHPDKNKGSKKYEDKLKKITLAYSQLSSSIEKK